MGMEYGNKIPSPEGLNLQERDYADSAQISNLASQLNLDTPYGGYTVSYIYNNRLHCNDSIKAVTAKYNSLNALSTPTSMKAKAIWSEGESGASVALIANSSGLSAISNITFASLHIVYKDNEALIQYWDNYVLTTLETYIYPTALNRDGITEYEMGWSVSGNDITVNCPNGETRVVSSPEAVAVMGQYCCLEHFWNGVPNTKSKTVMTYYEVTGAFTTIYDDFIKDDGAIGNTKGNVIKWVQFNETQGTVQ